ncbi:DMT family transporter [Thalassococcus sp. BH17M4-6]|uniref:DMT family transporter n=1 Tax=Thalassococcus sp. BH17M4-6 TaxID=3413148 RepID=UPI003BD5DAB2
MALFLLTALTMLAFAANSILNRMALVGGDIDALWFALVRLVAGAVTLAVLALATRGRLRIGGKGRAVGVVALLVYIYGFSIAYVSLDAGVGALILFGVVQITMFAGALIGGERPPARRLAGAGIAFAGLVWLLWPAAGPVVSPLHGALMAAAGFGWGVYSLTGRGETDPLQATAANFLLAVPFAVIIALLTPVAPDAVPATNRGVILAVLSGAVTSGLGYALWYSILPRLQASVAAVAQLTVPVIALAGGLVFLAEVPTLDFVLAAALVLGGVALSVLRLRR